jgi:sugar phosphate isomerase/epimerase
MKTCVSSYSFSRYLSSGATDQLGLIRLVKDMGFDAIEFTELKSPEGVAEKDYAAMLREESEKLSLPVANYTIGADFLNGESPEREAERLCGRVDIAKILGASGMRHDATGGYKGAEKHYKTFDDALPVLAKGCRMVTEYAKTQGIATMVENHGFFCQDSTRVERLVSAVGSDNFGLLVDIGNFLCADDPSVTAVGRVAPFAKHVHVKDFHVKSGTDDYPGAGWFCTRGGNYLRGAILGHGNVPVRQCLFALKRAEYDGYVSIEFEGMEDNLPAIEIGLDNLVRFISLI